MERGRLIATHVGRHRALTVIMALSAIVLGTLVVLPLYQLGLLAAILGGTAFAVVAFELIRRGLREEVEIASQSRTTIVGCYAAS